MSDVNKLYIPAGAWVVATLTSFCQARGIGNADIAGIGSITNVWLLLDPDGTLVVRNFSAGPSYEMTSLLGNVTLRQGMPMFDPSGLPTGAYPQIDKSVQTYNCYVHVHATFANPDMSISGGHLLDGKHRGRDCRAIDGRRGLRARAVGKSDPGRLRHRHRRCGSALRRVFKLGPAFLVSTRVR
jgi:predicted DNA-binding protein with PD1-like motif